jgi:hypothetical protein
MKHVLAGIAGLALVVSGLLGFSTIAVAQDGEPQPVVSRALSAMVDYGNDAIFEPEKHITDFDRLGVLPEQVLTITVQFPVELAGQMIIAEALDGGIVYAPDEGFFIGNDGEVIFQFQTGNAAGACRIAVHQPDDLNFVQFWIVDPNHPENTPPNLPGVY